MECDRHWECSTFMALYLNGSFESLRPGGLTFLDLRGLRISIFQAHEDLAVLGRRSFQAYSRARGFRLDWQFKFERFERWPFPCLLHGFWCLAWR